MKRPQIINSKTSKTICPDIFCPNCCNQLHETTAGDLYLTKLLISTQVSKLSSALRTKTLGLENQSVSATFLSYCHSVNNNGQNSNGYDIPLNIKGSMIF